MSGTLQVHAQAVVIDTISPPSTDTIATGISDSSSGAPGRSVTYGLKDMEFMELLRQVEGEAPDPARAVLSEGRKWVFEERGIIRGSCWDFVNEIFRRTGHVSNNRSIVFKGAVNGPYADPDLIRPGDWIYHRNYSYRNIPHSAIFIGWVDRDRRIAYTLSYAGEGRRSVARYLQYDLRKVYQIVRPGGI
jgi:hypothetical protein